MLRELWAKNTKLQGTLPIDYLANRSASCPLIDCIAYVCCALCNICDSIIPLAFMYMWYVYNINYSLQLYLHHFTTVWTVPVSIWNGVNA